MVVWTAFFLRLLLQLLFVTVFFWTAVGGCLFVAGERMWWCWLVYDSAQGVGYLLAKRLCGDVGTVGVKYPRRAAHAAGIVGIARFN